MKSYPTKYYAFVLLVLMTMQLHSQNNHLRSYTVEDGLPQSQVNSMIMDEKGYLWLGTNGGGLARFDGKTFKVYNEDQGLISNYIYDVKVANDSLFMATKSGLSIQYRSEFFNFEAPKINQIRKFGSTTFLLTDAGLLKFSKSNGIEQIDLHPEFNSSKITDLVFDGTFYWVGTDEGLWKFSELNSASKLKEHLDYYTYVSLISYGSKIYASTYRNGTLIISNNDFNASDLIGEPVEITSTSIQNGNQLWIGTENEGIFVFDTETDQLSFKIDQKKGLTASQVKCVLSTSYANIWIATSSGLFKYYQNNFKQLSIESGLNGNRIYSVFNGSDGVYFSTSENGIQKAVGSDVQSLEIPSEFKGAKIRTITKDSHGNLWAGSDGKGILFRKQSTASADETGFVSSEHNVFNSSNGFPFDWIRTIHAERDTIWAATYSKGIVKFRLDTTTNILQIFKTYSKFDGMEDLAIRHMLKDDQNRFWYATSKGHLGYLKGDKITHKGQVLGQENSINSILIHKNRMYLGTTGNGIWYSDDFNSFRKLSGQKPLPSPNVFQLIFDDEGFLWAGFEKGVGKIELSEDIRIKDLLFFGKNEGFPGRQSLLNAIDKDSDGNLWFGTMNGVVTYEPSETILNISKPNLFLEDLQIAYQSLDTLDLSLWSNSKQVLALKSDQRQISFTYRSIDIEHPDGIEYRFKLNDDDWSPWTKDNSQDFSELNYGAYDFTVQSRDYRWNISDPIRFSFSIETPLFQKLWFQGLLVGLIILIIIWISTRYVSNQKLKAQKEKERLKLENHLLSLEQKALRLQMNPHFIFNVLNGIKAMAPVKPEKMNDTVNNFAALLRETLNNSREETINLEQEIKTLKHYIQVEQLMAEEFFEYDIIVETGVDPEEILVPPMLIQPFVENAIRHGILKSSRKGKLVLQFKTEKDHLKIKIVDNGIGIKQSKQQQKADHKSMALKVTKERLASISKHHDLHIEELMNKNGEVNGTSVSFNIPLITDF